MLQFSVNFHGGYNLAFTEESRCACRCLFVN